MVPDPGRAGTGGRSIAVRLSAFFATAPAARGAGTVALPDAALSRRVVARIIDVMLAYLPALGLLFAAQSSGKKLCGIRVVARKTGLACGPLRSIIWNLFVIDFLIVSRAATPGCRFRA